MTIGGDTQKIGNYAFANCPYLTDVYCYAEKIPTNLFDYSILSKDNLDMFKDSYIGYATLHVPQASIKDYKATAPWSGFGKIVALGEVKMYNLIYKVDGTTYKTYQVESGKTITAEPTPTKEGYTFSGWIGLPTTMPAQDVTVTGTFNVNKYNLIYKVDGATYKTYQVEYGKTITPESAPTKAGYTFSGWTGLPSTMPAHDVTVTGRFTKNSEDEPETCTVNGVEYAIKSGNLIRNGTFDEGLAYWTGADDYMTEISPYAFDIYEEEGHGYYLVGNQNASQNSAYSLGTAWDIEPRKTYYFAYDVKYLRDTAGEALYLKSSLTNTKGVETEELGLPTLKPNEWTTFERVFTNSEEYAYCQVKFRWLAGLVGFDNFKLYEVERLTSELDAAKQEALAALDELPVGEGLLQYSAADIDKVKAAVEAAGTVAAVKAVGTPAPHMPEADTAYILSLKTQDEGSPYELAASTEGIRIVAAGQGTPVHLTPLEDGTWSITGNGLYLTYAGTNRWNLTMDYVPFGWIFRLVEGGYSIMGVYNGTFGYMGTNKTDGNAEGSSCHGNKSWSDGNVVWTITKYAEPANAINAPTSGENGGSRQIFSLDGKPANTLQKGVNIIRMENGKTKKLLVK